MGYSPAPLPVLSVWIELDVDPQRCKRSVEGQALQTLHPDTVYACSKRWAFISEHDAVMMTCAGASTG